MGLLTGATYAVEGIAGASDTVYGVTAVIVGFAFALVAILHLGGGRRERGAQQ